MFIQMNLSHVLKQNSEACPGCLRNNFAITCPGCGSELLLLQDNSTEERGHGLKLTAYQLQRGGRVIFQVQDGHANMVPNFIKN